MGKRLIEVGKMLANRPKDARPRIFRKFGKLDCMDCGKCCTEKSDMMIVSKRESGYQKIRKAFGRVERVEITDIDEFVVMDMNSDTCPLIEADNGCSIYENRPLICRVFPFIPQELGEGSRIVLTSHCPPLEELRKEGIEFLYFSDISCQIAKVEKEIEKYPKGTEKRIQMLKAKGIDNIGPTMLLNSLATLVFAMDRKITPTASIMRAGEDVYFPIF